MQNPSKIFNVFTRQTSIIFNEDFDPNKPDQFFKAIEKHGIACMDLIEEVKAVVKRGGCVFEGVVRPPRVT